jgi:predicted nucleic acid-binding protein
VIVLDTTVLVYAKGEAHPHRDPCRRVIELAASGELAATTTAEAIQEFVHVRARRRDRREAARLGLDYVDLLSPLLPVDDRGLRAGLGLFLAHPALGAFDAVLAAATLEAGASALISADLAFAGVPGLSHVVPDHASVDRLIGSR